MPVPPDPPPPFVPRDDLIVGLDELRKLLAADEAARRPPPFGADEGRIICLPLSHHPPLADGLRHAEHGYLAVSADENGHRALWVDRRVPNPEAPAWWERLIAVPRDVPVGRVAVTDGNGSVFWADLRELMSAPRPTG